MLVRIVDPSIPHLLSNSSSFTRILAPTDLIPRSTITSCAFFHFASHYRLLILVIILCSEVNNMGLICHVDLFPVPSGDSPNGSADPKRRQDQTQSSPSRASTSTLSPTPYSPGAQQYPYTYPAPQPPAPFSPGVPQQGAPLGNMSSVHGSHISPQQQAQAQEQQYAPNQVPANPTRPEEIVHYFKGTHPIAEGSRQTEALAGTTFVQAANLDYKGNKVLMFVFAVRVHTVSFLPTSDILTYPLFSFGRQDLAVKAEGNFILRYRCFDLFSRVAATTSDGQTPVWAECYGGPFRVYSTKEFPGLRASTDLTKVRPVPVLWQPI
jgi:Velvet factor